MARKKSSKMAFKKSRQDRDDARRGDGLFAKKKMRYLEGVSDVNPSDIELVSRFVTEHGKIIPPRITGATARQQRQIKRAVRRARVVGLLP